MHCAIVDEVNKYNTSIPHSGIICRGATVVFEVYEYHGSSKVCSGGFV